MAVDMVVRNGKVYTPYGFYEGSIIIDEGKVVSLMKGATPEADEVIDAGGLHVLPGMIDMHCHFRDPGFTEREDFETGTRAAAAGGVTTAVDMPNTVPSVTSVEALEEKIKIADAKALVDYALIGGAGKISAEALRGLAAGGVVAFKTFMIARFKELAASDAWMLDNFKVLGELGLPCLIHAENQSIVESGMEKAIASGRVDPIAHCEFRPAIAETEATMRTIILAGGTGVHLHICHMTTKGAVEALAWAQSTGRCVTGETSPNYLLMTEEDMKTKGPYAKVDPPLRKAEDQVSLWEAISNGSISVLASDHAPYPKSEKEKGWKNIFDAPSGGVGVQTSLPLMLNKVNEGRISLERLVEIFSVNPAKMLKLYPRKGVLIPGSDADLVIVDLKKDFEIREEDLYSKERASAFAGQKGKGMPITTVVRGKAIMKDGEILGKPGYGVFLRPSK